MRPFVWLIIFLSFFSQTFSQELYSYYLLSQELQVLSATKEGIPYSDVPRYTRIITKKEIERWGVKNLFELLDRLPEFYYWRSYFGLKAVGAFGLRQSYFSEKIQVLIDGLPVMDPSNGSSFSVNDIFSLANVKQVEIIYGPMTSLYGFNASLAVINLVTYKPQEKILNIESSFSSGHDSYLSFLKSFTSGKTSGIIAVNYIEERSPHRTYTDFLGTSSSYASFRKNFSYYFKINHSSGIYLKSYGIDRDDNFPLTLSKMISTDNSYTDRSGFINRIGFEKKSNSLKLNFFLDYNQFYLERGYNFCPFNHSICRNIPILNGNEPIAVEKRYVKNPGIGFLLIKDFESYGKLFVGTNYREAKLYKTELYANFLPSSVNLSNLSKTIVYNKVVNLPESEKILTPHLRSTFSPYIQYLFRNGNYSILLNGRWNKTNDTGTHWSYSLSILRKIKNFNLKLNTGRAIRIPSFEEMYIKNNPILKGNPNLKVEKADSLMPSLEYRKNNLSISGLVYFYWFRNFIYKQKISNTTYQWNNASSTVKTKGISLSIKKRLFNNYELEVTGERIFSISGLSCDYFEYPKKKLTLGITYYNSKVTVNSLFLAYSKASSQIPSFNRMDFNILVKLTERQNLSISVKNLLNKKIYYENRIPGEERTLWLSWQFSY